MSNTDHCRHTVGSGWRMRFTLRRTESEQERHLRVRNTQEGINQRREVNGAKDFRKEEKSRADQEGGAYVNASGAEKAR
ncbi:hypothetical protein EYF80_023848 [Liparis tanakae]|uniref:Uncharacterized protein n=1 Tax=Liparis tanakae TaxID=230148 RepID=A0A4Z2HKZ8_9TELE|nr:hypothetical protein EYF80_023848 [Liparis tanakae]